VSPRARALLLAGWAAAAAGQRFLAVLVAAAGLVLWVRDRPALDPAARIPGDDLRVVASRYLR
jgi:hypothetical protein